MSLYVAVLRYYSMSPFIADLCVRVYSLSPYIVIQHFVLVNILCQVTGVYVTFRIRHETLHMEANEICLVQID